MKKIRIRKLMILTLILLFLITGTIQSLYIYNRTLAETTEIVNTMYENKNEYQLQNIHQYLNKIESMALTIKTSKMLYDNIVKNKPESFNEKYKVNSDMNKFLTELAFSNDEIAGIVILQDNISVYKLPISFGYYNTGDITDPALLSHINSAKTSGYTETFSSSILSNSSYKNVFAYFEKVLNNGRHIATVCIFIDSNHIEKIVGKSTGEDILILKSGESIIYPIHPETELVNFLNKSIPEEKDKYTDYNGQKYLYTYSDLSSGLTLINLVPIKQLSSASSYISTEVLIGFLISLFLAILFAILFSNSFTKNIRQIIEKMNFIGTDKYEPTESSSALTEVSELNNNCNKLNIRINRLVEEVVAEHNAINKTKIDLLKAQINPHFIYNTLDTINWLAINAGATEISEMVSDLGNMFRYSLNDGKNFTTIKNELNHLRLYLSIQRHRHKDQFSVAEDIDASLLEGFTLNMILQPIIENCLVHGFKSKDSIVNISISLKKTKDGKVRFIISDDGAGCNEALLNSYVNSIKYSMQGYGVKNINERIKLYFGEGYGIKYKKVEVGTKVEITIPLLTDIPEDKEDALVQSSYS